VIEVGPRDGLQNESQPVPTATKIAFIERLQQAGVQHLEATSFVSPKWVPQLADAADVMAGLTRSPGVTLSVLTPNMKGLEAALAAGANEIVVFSAASEAFCQRNIHCSIAESIARFQPVVRVALDAGLGVRGSISCAVGCPYEGEIAPARVAEVAARYRDLGVVDVSVADTIGVGTPHRVQAALEAAIRHFDVAHVGGHFHDTYGQALANIYASLELGVATFDASVSGLGGCPYAVGATGNVATEDLVYLLHGLGIQTGIDLTMLAEAGRFIRDALGQTTNSRVARALTQPVVRG
jgi:hydroxymethylglutaryl-CoA lyase